MFKKCDYSSPVGYKKKLIKNRICKHPSGLSINFGNKKQVTIDK